MGSRGGVGCVGAVGLLIVVSMIISLIVFLVGVAAVVAGLGAAGWLLSSAVADLRRRARLTQGTEPLQASGTRAQRIAAGSYSAAQEALASTLAAWRYLSVTRAIGTPLQESFDRLERRAVHDVAFQDLLLRAETEHARSVIDRPVTVADLTRQTVDLDRLNSELRRSVHRMVADETGR